MPEEASAAPQLERVTDEAPATLSSLLGEVRDQFEGGGVQGAETAPPPPPAALSSEQSGEEVKPTTTPETVAETASESPPETPPPAPEPPPSIPTPESRLAPLFELTSLPPAEAMPKAVGMMEELYQYDQVAYGILANAVLRASPQSATRLVLEAQGIPAEKVTQFTDWLAKGGDALPEPAEYPAFDSLIQKLESLEGEERVRLPNGAELDLTDPRDKAYFELEKRLYDGDVKEKVQARQEAVSKQQQEAEQRQQEAQEAQASLVARADHYTNGRYAIADEMVDRAIAALSPEDKFRGEMLKAYARTFIDSHAEITKLGKQAIPYVQQGHGFEKGADGQWRMNGRVKDFADAQDRIIRRELNTLIDRFNKDLLRVNRAELAATATEPKIPEGVKGVEVNSPPVQGLDGLTNFNDILAAAREIDRHAGAGR